MPQTIQRSFTSGEIAPALHSRADLSKYATGLRTCENFFIKAQGGVYSRPGFRFIGEIADSSQKARLIPFSFNTEQTYVLVFEDLRVRVVKDGGFVLNSTDDTVYELETPYTVDQIQTLGYAQSADVMTIVHPDHDPMNLNRLADDEWTLEVIDYASTIDAPVINSVTSVGDGFGDYSKQYEYVVTAVAADGSESLASASVVKTNASLATTGGLRISWSAVTDADYYRVYKDPSVDTGIYGWIGDSNTTTFDDYNIAPITSDAPPQDRRPFDGTGNKPSAVTYYQQRQVFANTYNEPQATFTTQTNNFDSLRVSNPARDDDAVTWTIAARQVNEIRHLLPLDALLVLTSGAEWKTTEGDTGVLTPSTIGVRIQSYNGCSTVPPVVINSTALYIQEKGTRLRDLGYEFSSDKYTGNDLSLMAEHLFEGFQITSMTYADEPHGIVWCVRSDGVLLGLTYQREHQVWGWHKHTTQGEFESVASITEDGRDAVYVIVKRTVNGETVRYVERLEKRESAAPEDCFYVDSGLSYDGDAVTSIGGLDHLEGETVTILTDGYTVPDQTVVDGAITLQRAASKIHVGLKYTPVVETLDIDTPSPTQTLKSNSVSVSKATIEVEKSRGGWVGPLSDSGTYPVMSEIKPRFDSDNYDRIALKTFKQEVFIDPQWSKGGGLRIEQRDPLPMSILSIIPQIDVGGN